ncbi:TonB-dependent receptor [Kiritimatiellaeota bacterium B1221]|nr:TonB-dependent receptor [Kiritimatiellaeota bacterium B1221]
MYRLLLVGAASVVSAVSAQSLETHTLTPLQVSNRALPASEVSSVLALPEQQQELGKSLNTLPGVSLRQQGAHGGEPVLRGLGWERVTTQYNGLQLYGACPSRMDPPVSMFTADSLQSAMIELGPASVIHGPMSTGGRILLSDELNFAAPGEKIYAGSALAGYGSNGKDRTGSLTSGGASDHLAWQIDAGADEAREYTSGDNQKIPAGGSSQHASAQFKSKIADAWTLDLSTRWIYDQDIIYLSLPMDSRHSKTNLYTGKLSWTPEGESLTELSFRAGAGTVDHLMDNRDKPNRMMMQASTPSTADSYDAGILGKWNIQGGELRSGIDGSILDRDALRTRKMTATGMTFEDPIWPDLTREQIGIFGEWEGEISEKLTLRAGARLDQIQSDAGKADAVIVPGPGIGKTTVNDAWQTVGGSTRSDPAQEDTLVSANLILSRNLSDNWLAQIGLSRTEAGPNLTQRYLSFGPVPGGYGIGTPTLDPETKYEIELRSEGQIGSHRLGFAAFVSRMDDYLLPTTVAMMDVNGDGNIDRIKGTVNQDAEMWGLEASLHMQIGQGLSLPMNFSWVRGQTTAGDDLPEIPPMEFDAALRWEGSQESHPYGEFGMRFAYKQDHIDSAFGEDETPSFAVLHLRGGMEVLPGWIIEAGIENLLDREYHEHLTREALLPLGDLAAGDEVPAPGRSFTLSTRINW